ncbi:FBLN2 isoform 7, partial [Pan troglodytes]
VDECALGTHNCSEAETCHNIQGSFRCLRFECPPNYVQVSKTKCERTKWKLARWATAVAGALWVRLGDDLRTRDTRPCWGSWTPLDDPSPKLTFHFMFHCDS